MQKDDSDKTTYYKPADEIYKITKGDILYIKVISGNEEIDRKFSLISDGANNSMLYSLQGNGIYYTGFFVNDSGKVIMPIVGSVKVQGLTIFEAEKTIKKHINQYLDNPLVIVKLNSLRFTVLGMIKQPGVQISYSNTLTVFDAISMAGDIPVDGIPYKINILRKTNDGIKKIELDLTDIKTVESEGYYIMNNDIIYIQPRNRFFVRNDFKDFLLLVGSASSLITAIVLLANFGL